MAGTFLFNSMPARMTKLGLDITRGVTKLAQEVAIGIGATVVDTTKVDTGLARSNWRASISSPASGTIPAYAPGVRLGIGEGANASAAKAQQKQAIEQFDASTGQSIFITNNIPYIAVLNNGDSKHEAGDMVRMGVQTGRAVIQAKVRITGAK